jgi:integrase
LQLFFTCFAGAVKFDIIFHCLGFSQLYVLENKKIKEKKRSFKSALCRVGIKDFQFHDLRHMFANHLIMAGVDIITVKELLGHKSLTMTLRYAHLAPSHKTSAVDVLDDMIGNQRKVTFHKLNNQTAVR